MARISVRVEKSGRLLLPAAVRRKLGIKEGESSVLLDIDETPIRVSTRAQALARIRAELAKFHRPGDDWTAELLRERRQEAAWEESHPETAVTKK